MKKISTWLLVVGLLVITANEFYHYRHLRQHYQQSVNASPNLIFASSSRGTRKKVTLPDGSIVWLNAASSLLYPADMATGDRTVELFGEAFFDVVRESSHPFKVKAREMSIEVWGTQFDTRNYAEEMYSRVVVVSGTIRVSYHNQSAILRSGESAEVNPTELNDRAFSIEKGLDTATAAAWTRGVLTFDDFDLRSLLRELSRSYNVDIQLEGPVSDHHFQGTLSLQEPLENVLQRLVVPYVHVTISRPSERLLIIRAKR